MTGSMNHPQSPPIIELLPAPLHVECILLMGRLGRRPTRSDQARAWWREARKKKKRREKPPLLIPLRRGNVRGGRPGNRRGQRCRPALPIRFYWAVIAFTATPAHRGAQVWFDLHPSWEKDIRIPGFFSFIFWPGRFECCDEQLWRARFFFHFAELPTFSPLFTASPGGF